MLCERESLLTNSTRVPTAICTAFGLTPADVIVMVLVDVGGVVLDGALDEPPHETAIAVIAMTVAARGQEDRNILRPS